MAARCANCLGVIIKGTPFLIDETEVFHQSCVREQGTVNSLRNRQHRQLVELEAEQAVLERETKDLLGRIARLDTEHHQLRDRATDALAREGRALAEAASARDARDRIHTTLNRAVRELEEKQEEARALRHQLTMHETLTAPLRAQAGVTPVSETAPGSAKQDDRDATVVRYSLLELD